MYQAAHNVDFPPYEYSTPSTSVCYPQMPRNHESAPIPLSQQITSNPTHVHKGTSLAGPSRGSEPPNASLQIKVIEHLILSQPPKKWQRVRESITWTNKKILMLKKTDYWLGETLTTTNQFSKLVEETTEEAPAQHTESKPPPIFISGVVKIKPLVELLNVIAPNKYLVKTLSNEQVRVQTTESSIYTTIIKALMEKNTEFHTYKPRQERSIRAEIRNLHPSTEVQDTKRVLIEKGHEVTNVWNANQRNTNRPLPLLFIDIKPHSNNKEIYKITTLLNTVVKVEAPYVKQAIPQCMRCETYGQTKNYCRYSPRCVKCAEQHLTSECCTKVQDDKVKCANCSNQHPANYGACMVHKQLQQQIYPKLRDRQIPQNHFTTGAYKINSTETTYAQAVKR
jgi:hypothetical protein